MKKQITLIVLMFLPMMASAYEGEAVIDGINYYINTEEETAEVRANYALDEPYDNSYSGDVVIPETIEYERVVCHVVSIGEYALAGCTNLTNVTIPSSVTTIGSGAFINCTDLVSITIPNSVTIIGGNAFSECSSLTSINIPNSVTSIEDGLFYGCANLASITIPNSVTSIGGYAFSECSSLTSITIPNSVTSLGESPFYGCSNLTSITIGNSVTSLGEWVLLGCSGLTSIIVESGNPVYDSRDNCNAIIRTTDNVLIAGCQSTTIPNSVTGIEGWAFQNCINLTSIIIPNSVTSIGRLAFDGCTGLTSVTIPNSVTSIGSAAFENCINLTSIIIPNSVISLGDWPFYGCSGLTSIVVESGNTVYDSRNNCNAIIRTSDNKLITGCQNTTIPNTVTSIGSHAFTHCSTLADINIPNSVTSIGEAAFSNCTGLTSITIPNTVASIGDWAFQHCSNLSSVTIGTSVRKIGKYAFANCTDLTNVYCYAERIPTTVNNNVFNESNIENATLHVPGVSISEYTNTAPWSAFGGIVEISNETPEKCATPIITYANGQVHFACETEDVAFVPTVTCTPTQLQDGNVLDIGGTFTVSVYATKEGYVNSDIATKTITINKLGDIDGDGQLSVTDVTSLVNAILGK